MSTGSEKTSKVALGEIVAERQFTLFERSGAARQIVVQIGKPVCVDREGKVLEISRSQDSFRCPLRIAGLEIDDKIFAPFGEDGVMALQYAMGLVGQILDEAVRRLDLLNPLEEARKSHPDQKHFDATGYPDWLWRYDSRPNLADGMSLSQ